MSQHDFEITTADANTGTTFRAAVNAALRALASNNLGALAASTPYDGMLQWFDDTTTWTLKYYNGSGFYPILTIAKSSGEITSLSAILDEDAMTSNSATLPPSQQSVKAYVDNHLLDEDDFASDSAVLPPSQQSVKAYVNARTVIGGQYRNLAIKNNSIHPTYQLDISADILIVENAGGQTLRLASFSESADITASGANGLDTGAEANSTWYHIWAIAKDDGTTAGLLSASATAPTLPSGYTFQAYLGAVYNDGSGNFWLISQADNRVVVASLTALSGGTQSTYTEISLAAIVPSTAKRVWGTAYSNAGGYLVYVASTSGGFGEIISGNGASSHYGHFTLPITTSQKMYYKVGAGTAESIFISGWDY